MAKTIQDYLPHKEHYTFIQGRVPSEITKEAKQIMEKNNLSWSDVLTACIKKFIDEMNRKK